MRLIIGVQPGWNWVRFWVWFLKKAGFIEQSWVRLAKNMFFREAGIGHRLRGTERGCKSATGRHEQHELFLVWQILLRLVCDTAVLREAGFDVGLPEQ